MFVRFLEESEDTKKSFRNYLTFRKLKKLHGREKIMFVCPVPVVKTRRSVPKDCQNWERKEDDDLGFCGSLWLKKYKDNRIPFIFKCENLIIRIFRDQLGILRLSMSYEYNQTGFFLCFEFETLVIHIYIYLRSNIN